MRLPLMLLAASFAGSLALAGCDTVNENTGACPVPPPLQAETRPKPPVSEDTQIWQPGHWDWNGSTYAWREGAWIKQGTGSNLWMDGHWARDHAPAPCYWVPAHWVQ